MKIILDDYELDIKAKSRVKPRKRCTKKDFIGFLNWLIVVLVFACYHAKRKNKKMLPSLYRDIKTLETMRNKLERNER